MKRLLHKCRKGWIVLSFLFIFPSQIYAFDKWDDIDKTLLALSTTTLVIDWGQTRTISRNPDQFYERTNPILRKHPSTLEVDLYFAISVLGNATIAHMLPSEWRKVWLASMLFIEIGSIYENNRIGIGIRF